MKALFVGDIHNKLYMFENVKELDEKYSFDRIIFLGDYIDDWNTTNKDSQKVLEKVINLKKSNKEKYTFLLGNHEYSYLGSPCSGHDFVGDETIEKLLKINLDLFDLYTCTTCGRKEFICTHAGINNKYAKEILNSNFEDNYKVKFDKLNQNKLDINTICKCNKLRGGKDEYSGFVWCDRIELLDDIDEGTLEFPYQIVGHNPVPVLLNYDKNNNQVIYTDTHSTYSTGTHIGDCSYLIWDDYRFITEFSQ